MTVVSEVETRPSVAGIPGPRVSTENSAVVGDRTYAVSLVNHTETAVLQILALPRLQITNGRFSSNTDPRGRRFLRSSQSSFRGKQLSAAGTVTHGQVSLIEYDPNAPVADQLPPARKGVLHVVPLWQLLVYVELRRRPDVVCITEEGRLARIQMEDPGQTDREKMLERLLTWGRVRLLLLKDKQLTVGAALRQVLAGEPDFYYWALMYSLGGQMVPFNVLGTLKPGDELPLGPVDGWSGRKALGAVQTATDQLVAVIPD